MRRILVPLLFVALLTVASIVPAAASGPAGAQDNQGEV